MQGMVFASINIFSEMESIAPVFVSSDAHNTTIFIAKFKIFRVLQL
jgi:hypothetical protein